MYKTLSEDLQALKDCMTLYHEGYESSQSIAILASFIRSKIHKAEGTKEIAHAYFDFSFIVSQLSYLRADNPKDDNLIDATVVVQDISGVLFDKLTDQEEEY